MAQHGANAARFFLSVMLILLYVVHHGGFPYVVDNI